MTDVQDTFSQLLRPSIARTVLRAALKDHMGEPEIARAWVERCWPGKKGEVAFEWGYQNRDGSIHFLYGSFNQEAEAHAPQACAAPAASFNCTNPVDGQLRGLSINLPKWRLRVFSPDRDSRLHQLTSCLEPATVFTELLGRRRAASAGLLNGHARVVAFKPTRRATIAYAPRAANGRLKVPRYVGKAFFNLQGNELIARHRIVAEQLQARSGRRIAVPSPSGFIAPLKLAMFEWSRASETATARLDQDDFVFALAALHGVTVPALPTFDLTNECSVVREWCGHLQAVASTDASVATAAAEQLITAAATQEPQPSRVIHRDFYEQQLLSDGRTLTLLDLDTLAVGPVALDLGNLAAHWALKSLVAGRRPGLLSTIDSILGPYRALAEPVDPRAMWWFTASALIRIGAVHSLRTHTKRFSPMLWRHAVRLIAMLLK